ncbi:fatty acid--CoA ligase family protein, partial [bacterium]|nr:fatty acid--CoA ligase family protein [bacterium]
LDRCPLVYKTYGMTESGSMLTCARPGCDDTERYSAGSVLPETIIRIVDDEGRACRATAEGNVLVHGPGLFDGYVNDPERTALTLCEGWLKTGDFGYLDGRGNLNILARRSDLILSGGENIIPAEVEQAIKLHPQVSDALVLPLQDEQWGQVPGAVIVSADDELSQEIIIAFLRERIASYKLPRRFVFVAKLPALPTGKVDLPAVRKLLEA